MAKQPDQPDKGGLSSGKDESPDNRDLGPYGDRDDQLPGDPARADAEAETDEGATRRSHPDTDPPRH
jgi:hypothetical protein